MAKSRFKATKRKSKGGKKSSGAGKRTTSARKSSALKKSNRRATREKMARNREKYKSSKGNLQQAKKRHAEYLRSEEKRFATESQAIKNRPDISDEKRRRKLTRLQLARRQREKVASSQLATQEQTHLATRERYRSAQQRQLDKYRQRKRAVDFADRYSRTSVRQSTTVVTPSQRYGAAPMVYGGAAYGAAPVPYGVPPPQPYGAVPYGGAPMPYGAAPSQPYGGAPGPYGGPPPPYGDAPEGPMGDAPMPEQYGETPREEPRPYAPSPTEDVEARQVLTGVEEKEEEVPMRDIPALSDLDPRALRAFLRARDKFEAATTPEDKVRYSVEFFELATKLDAMFHLHTDVWHRVMKYRPPGRSIAEANAFADALSKESVVELSKMSSDQLRVYLADAF